MYMQKIRECVCVFFFLSLKSTNQYLIKFTKHVFSCF